MKKLAFAVVSSLVFAGVSLAAQSIQAAPLATQIAPLGVWNGTLDGLPGVTLTLADDAGELAGTVVFYAVNGKAHRIMLVNPHILLHPKMEGDMLSFQIKLGGNRSGLARVTVVFGSDNKAQIHCLDCGPGSPTAEIVRQTAE